MSRCLTIDEILLLHDMLIDRFGGTPGVRDMGALESAVGRLNTGYYNDVIEETAALMESLANNHPFIDGNKRIAFFSADVFLRMNEYYIECDNNEAHQHFINLFHERRFCIDELAKWIKKNVKKTL